MTKEDKIRQKLTERKRIANQQNAARLAKSKAYQEAAPTPANLYNAFINWFLGTKQLGGQSQYITGNAPVGGRRGQLLNLQQLRNLQLRTLRHKNVKAYQDAMNRMTEQDATRELIRQRANDPRFQEAKNASAEYWNDFQKGAYDNPVYKEVDDGFDPELELLEYNYGGTDSYPYLYNIIAERRGWPLMRADGLNY